MPYDKKTTIKFGFQNLAFFNYTKTQKKGI